MAGNNSLSVSTTDEILSNYVTKDLVTAPTSGNNYTGRYKIDADVAEYINENSSLKSLDIIDESTGPMTILPETITLSAGDDAGSLAPVDPSNYTLLFDDGAKRLICSIDLETVYDYYRLEYDVTVSGLPGTSVSISNKAYIAGMGEAYSGSSKSVSIQKTSGSAQGVSANLKIYKYNADDMTDLLPDAEFVLYGLDPSVSTAMGSQSFSNQAAALTYIGRQDDPWLEIARGVTDSNGLIEWKNGGTYGDNQPLFYEPNHLYKLAETRAPDGYVVPEDNAQYFYFGLDGLSGTSYLRKFDSKPLDCTLFISNNKGNFMVRKTDGATGGLLSKAVFELYEDEACTALAFRGIEAEKGMYYFGDLDLGSTYYLKEVIAPDGYLLDDTVHTINVGDTGVITADGTEIPDYVLTVTNGFVDVKPEKTVSLDNETFGASAAIGKPGQEYRYRMSYAPKTGRTTNVILYDRIENDTFSRYAGTVTGIDLTGCNGIAVEAYVQGDGLGSGSGLPDAFAELPGEWEHIDPDAFAGWEAVDAIALYFGEHEFSAEDGTGVYADVLMKSVPDGRNNPSDDFGGVTVTFGPECATEGSSWDYVELWYRQDGQFYRAGRWGGTGSKNTLANMSVNLPTSDFYLYWRTDDQNSSYYGFDVASVTPCRSGFIMTAKPGSLPDLVPEEATDPSELTSAFGDYTHGDYGNGVRKLWHYSFRPDSFEERVLDNGLKAVYSIPGAVGFHVKDTPETTVEVTYEIPDDPGYELPRTGGTGVMPFMAAGTAMTAAACLFLYGRKRRRGL